MFCGGTMLKLTNMKGSWLVSTGMWQWQSSKRIIIVLRRRRSARLPWSTGSIMESYRFDSQLTPGHSSRSSPRLWRCPPVCCLGSQARESLLCCLVVGLPVSRALRVAWWSLMDLTLPRAHWYKVRIIFYVDIKNPNLSQVINSETLPAVMSQKI